MATPYSRNSDIASSGTLQFFALINRKTTRQRKKRKATTSCRIVWCKLGLVRESAKNLFLIVLQLKVIECRIEQKMCKRRAQDSSNLACWFYRNAFTFLRLFFSFTHVPRTNMYVSFGHSLACHSMWIERQWQLMDKCFIRLPLIEFVIEGWPMVVTKISFWIRLNSR